MCALLVCLLSFLLLLLLLLLFVYLRLPYLHPSPPFPHSWQSLFTCFIFFCFSLHIPSLFTLSLFLTLIYRTQFSLFFFFLMMKSSLGRLLTSFVAFTHTLLLSGFPSVRISTLAFPRLLLSSLHPLPLSLFLALPSVAFLRWTIASWSP